jgi:uncharacterized lipoprotein YddW (UPF0748 family)
MFRKLLGVLSIVVAAPGCIVYVVEESECDCGTKAPGDAAVDAPQPDAVPTDGGCCEDAPADAPEASVDADADAPPTRPLIDVSHVREVRGAWVASVSNIDWPSRTGLSPAAAKAELEKILDALRDMGANTVKLQIRPESDALYASTIEPWSRFLTGTQGVDPGWDPLAFAVAESHARGLELHAWINPYRAASNRNIAVAANHVAKTQSQYAYVYDTSIVMDPGAAPVRDHVVSVVTDVVARYDVDGIVFDDYFYPYPKAGVVFPDDATYAAYTSAGGTLSKADWRRSNVNALVEAVAKAIAKTKPHVRFGISPFGIWRPNNPPGVVGLDAYSEIYADALAWLDGGWVDYVGPQLYWATTSSGQPFVALNQWWTAQAKARGRWNVPSLAAYKMGTAGYDLAEFRAEFTAIRGANADGCKGAVFFSMKQLLADLGGLASMVRAEYWSTPAVPPPLATATSATFDPPQIQQAGGTWQIGHAQPSVRGYMVYDTSGATPIPRRWIRGASAAIELPAGSYAISAVDQRDVESKGVRVDAP